MMTIVNKSALLAAVLLTVAFSIPLTASPAEAQCKSKSCLTKTKSAGKAVNKTAKKMAKKVTKKAATAKIKKAKKTTIKAAGTKPRNVIWAPGAQKTKFGGMAKGAQKTPFGVMKGQKATFGAIGSGAHLTSFGVLNGRQTSFGATATGAQKTSSGFMGAGCKKTAVGVRCSDIRLKRDIVELGQLDNGIGIYRFRYLWSDQAYVGVIAQDVAHTVPAAVMRGPDGYLRVDYHRLGLRLETWDEWNSARRVHDEVAN